MPLGMGSPFIPSSGGSSGGNVNITQVGGSNITLGQKTMANSFPVVIASDQSAIPVTLTPSGTQDVNLTQVGGASISLGQALAAASLPVVLTAAQITTLTPLSTVAATQSGTWNVGSSSATGSAVPANAFYVAGLNAAGNLEGRRNAAATLNTTTGIEASGMVAVFDDTSPTSITENQFGSVRMSANRNIYQTIRDAAGNERGVNVNASNQLSVSVDNTPAVTMTSTTITSLVPGVAATSLGKAEDAVHASGDTGVMSLAVRNDAGTAFAADGDYVPFSMDSGNNLRVNVIASTSLTIGSISTSVTPGTAAANLGKAEDAGHVSGDTGVMALVVRHDTLGALAGTDLDYSPLQVSAVGALYVEVAAGSIQLQAGANTVGSIASITTSIVPGTATTSLGKAEDAAHTTGDTGVFALGVRNDTLADTTNTTADYSQLSTDLKGRLMVGSAPRTLKANQVTTITASTSETTIATAVASTFLDLYGIIITNTSATAVNVAIKDDTAGTTRFNIAVPAADTRGFMLPVDAAIKQSAVNHNWTATSSASVSSLVITALTVANV